MIHVYHYGLTWFRISLMIHVYHYNTYMVYDFTDDISLYHLLGLGFH